MKNMTPSKAAHGNAGGAPGQMLAGSAEGSLKGCCGITGIGSPLLRLYGRREPLALRLRRLGSRNADSAEPHRHLDARHVGGSPWYRSGPEDARPCSAGAGVEHEPGAADCPAACFVEAQAVEDGD